MSFRTTDAKREAICALARQAGRSVGEFIVERALAPEAVARAERIGLTLHVVRFTQRSDGKDIEFARIFVEEDGKRDWIGEIEVEKQVFRSRFHHGFTRELLRALLAKWESEALS